MRPTPRELALATVSGALVEIFVGVITSTFPGPNGSFGAPIPMGESPGLSFIFPGGDSAFYWPFFLIDVLVTGAALLLAFRWGGIEGGLAATVGGLMGSVIALISFLLMRSGMLPFAGLPIPVAFPQGTGMNALLLWVDCLLLGLLGFAVWHGTRVLRRHDRLPRSNHAHV